MSRRSRSRLGTRARAQAGVFAALGDATRLVLITKLSSGEPRSITQLTQGSRLTRQAITKHLRVLQSAGIVHNVHSGRESLFSFELEPIVGAKEYLDFVSQQWEQALGRLKAFVEK